MKPKLYIEVTNTVNVNFISGIQRLTMRLLEEFRKLETNFEIIPIVYCSSCQQFRRLNGVEEDRLYAQQNFSFTDRIKRKLHFDCSPSKRIKQPEAGSIFFDIESGWHNPYSRMELLAALKEQGLKTALLLSDIIPYLYPQYVHPQTITKFKAFFEAHLAYSDLIVCNSASTCATLRQRFGSELEARSIATEVVLLGADYQSVMSEKPVVSVKAFQNLKDFILAVGTIEPRKNFALLLKAFDQIAERQPAVQLVFAGKRGWMSDDFFEALHQHPLYQKRIFWFEGLDDDALAYLYQNASLFAFPSFFEGFGLPVAEALIQGVPTISSDRGALPEVGRDFADYCDPEEVAEWVAQIEKYMSDPQALKEKRLEVKGYQPPTWKSAARKVLDILEHRYLVKS